MKCCGSWGHEESGMTEQQQLGHEKRGCRDQARDQVFRAAINPKDEACGRIFT